MRSLFALFSLLLLTACQQADPPTGSWEVAVQGLYSGALSSDGQYAIVGSINHGGSLWSTRDKERLFNWNHQSAEYTGLVAAAFSPEGRYAATAGQRTIVLWQVSTGEPVWFWTAPGDVLDIDLTPNGDYALLGLDNHTAVVFDIKNGGIKRTFNHDGKVRTVALSADGRFALTGSDDRSARLWDLQTGQQLYRWDQDNQLITTALSANGRYAFTAAQAGQAVIWDTTTGAQLAVMPIKKGNYIAGASYTAARFSADASQLLTGTNSQLIQLWSVTDTSQPLRTWQATKKSQWKPTSTTVIDVAFANASYYALASNGLAHLLK